jgi:hypothetical protein
MSSRGAPQNSLDLKFEFALGSFETSRAQGFMNLPLSNSAMRFAFIASEGDGYIRNSVDDGDLQRTIIGG